MKGWYEKLKERRKLNNNKKTINKNINPKIVPRNHIVEKVLSEVEKGKYNNLDRFIINLKSPYKNDKPNEFVREPNEEEKVHETFCGT